MSSKNFYGLTGDVTVDGGILNVGNAQLYANTETSNVGIGTSNPEFELDVHGNANVGVLYSTFLHGDGSNIQNIVSSQWEGSLGDPIYYASNVGIANTSPVTATLQIGSNVVVDDVGSNVIHVTGNIYADYLVGDGSQLTGIAASLDQIVDQGNTVSNTIQIVSGQDTTSNVGLVTYEGVGISVSNTNPTGEFQFGVGSNLLVNVYSSNVLTVDGNVFAQKMTLGTVTVTPAYNLEQITATGASSGQTITLSNVTTAIDATANVLVGGKLDVEGNVHVGERIIFDANVYVDSLRIADLAANLVTYDAATGELMDSAGLFSNKLAVVSEQPPVALTGASTTVTSHGTYTIEASSGTVTELFDKNVSTVWTTSVSYNTLDGSYTGSNSLAGVSGEWAKITMPYKTILRHAKIESTNSSIKDLTIVGLNADGLTWTSLKTINGLNEETSTIIVNATTHHRIYGIIVRATNVGSTQAEIGDLRLFTESFSIDGGKVAMASSAVMGGETTVDQHGPHARGEAKLKKYPEIAFDASKADTFANSNAYTQAGYEISSTSRFSSSYDVLSAFNGTHQNDHFASQSSAYSISSPYNYTLFTNNVTDKDSTQYTGEEIKVKMPQKIKLSKVHIVSYVGASSRKAASGHIFGSNTGANGSWTKLADFTNLNTGTSGHETVSISTTEYYEWYSLVVTNLNGSEGLLNVYELEFYGYEEDPPLGDTSVDTTFTSIMNTPQTTGANVYVDGSLGETFTNRVTGPDATGPPATYDATGKYWELNGSLESNIAVEANTFLSGDQPHAVSVWFNSSNLEANVSNTCVFSVSDQEKLDSVNLDLQSNTWHNLTYAYQGEGGSRVTYLDGRKVAEDQAEDTFGDYPPFAMTGYSQGGYVVSASNSAGTNYESWRVFDDTDYGWETDTSRYNTSSPYTHTAGVTTVTNVSSRLGDYIQIDFPYKIQTDFFDFTAQNYSFHRSPHTGVLAGSNDGGVSWTELKFFDVTVDGSPTSYSAGEITRFSGINPGFYKSFRLIWLTLGTGSNNNRAACEELQFYGHRENDLVRLPDPTRVLKYPHIAMTGPAQRGYVLSRSYEGEPINRWYDEVTSNFVTFGPGNYNGSASGAPGATTGTYNGISNLGGTVDGVPGQIPDGEWHKIKMPHKILLSKLNIVPRITQPDSAPYEWRLYGSNDDSDWTLLYNKNDTSTIPDNASGADYSITTSTAFKYFAIVMIKSVNYAYLNVGEFKWYGTGVDSIPIQIGGGNIDKVANFRVYDKFVGEDQALEIWDAQKDTFRGVKNSATLHKGRLGIGTTEPEGRLAVADEPHNLEEFPPRAMQSSKVSINAKTGYYDTHFEGHGTFTAYGSYEYVQPNDARVAWKAFSKQTGGNSTAFGYMNSGNHYTSGGTIYNGPESNGGISGDFLGLKFPYKVKITHFFMMSYVTSTSSRGAKEGYLMGRINGGDWQQVHFFQNKIFKALEYTKFEFENDTFYDEYILVVTKTTGATVWNASELRYFGTREQGQSVLHDGQLTLTKNLNVPRIGPALDADDTPRRDRLVVEYNTSTNPTFEGAVRDTSGRGNDGFMVGSSYDSTDKSLSLTNSPTGTSSAATSYITRQSLGNKEEGNFHHSASVWFKMSTPVNSVYRNIFEIGPNPRVNGKDIALYVTSDSATPFGFASGGNTLLSTGSATSGQVYHIVIVYDGSKKYIYINGVLNNSAAYTSFNGVQNMTMQIGRNNHANANEGVDGSISNFKMYVGHALTAQEVKTLYDMGRCDEGNHVVNFSKTRVGIGLGDGEAPRAALDVRGDIYGGCPVFFHATRTTHAETTSSAGFDPLIWQLTRSNKGGGYSTTTGKFTAPIAGYYEFIYGGMTINVNERLELIPKLNNARYAGPLVFISPDSAQQHRYGTATAIVYMNVGDTWHIEMPANASGGMYGTGLNYNMFTGKFLSY